MFVQRVLLLCGATLLLLGGGQALSIGHGTRSKRGCSAEGSDLTSKETMYQKMFHNAFSKFLEAMVKCSEEYAQKKKLVNCFDGDAQAKKQVRDADDAVYLPLTAADSSRLAESVVAPPEHSPAHKRTTVAYLEDTSPPADILDPKPMFVKDVESKYNEVAGPDRHHSRKHTFAKPPSDELVTKEVSTTEHISIAETVLTTDKHADPEPKSLHGSYSYGHTNYAEPGSTEHPEISDEGTTKATESEIHGKKNIELDPLHSIENEKYFNEDTAITTEKENSLEYFPQSKKVQDKFENAGIASPRSEDDSHTTGAYDKDLVTVTDHTETDYTKFVTKPQPKYLSEHSQDDYTGRSDLTTTDATHVVMPVTIENVNLLKAHLEERGEHTGAEYSEQTTTAIPEEKTDYPISKEKTFENEVRGSNLNDVFAESRQDNVVLKSPQHKPIHKKKPTFEKLHEDSVTSDTFVTRYVDTADKSPTMSIENKDKEIINSMEVETTTESFTRIPKKLQETVSSDIHTTTIDDDLKYESFQTTSEKPKISLPNILKMLNSEQPEDEKFEKLVSEGPETSETVSEDSDGKPSSHFPRHLETSEPDNESHEKSDSFYTTEQTTVEPHKDWKTSKPDLRTVTVPEAPHHTTIAPSSPRSLPQEPSRENNYSSTELSPNSHEGMENSSGKPYDRFGRGSAALQEGSHPEQGDEAVASLKSEDPSAHNTIALPQAASSNRQSEYLLPEGSVRVSDNDDTATQKAKLGCKCDITEDFLKLLKKGMWKSLFFEIRPEP